MSVVTGRRVGAPTATAGCRYVTGHPTGQAAVGGRLSAGGGPLLTPHLSISVTHRRPNRWKRRIPCERGRRASWLPPMAGGGGPVGRPRCRPGDTRVAPPLARRAGGSGRLPGCRREGLRRAPAARPAAAANRRPVSARQFDKVARLSAVGPVLPRVRCTRHSPLPAVGPLSVTA